MKHARQLLRIMPRRWFIKPRLAATDRQCLHTSIPIDIPNTIPDQVLHGANEPIPIRSNIITQPKKAFRFVTGMAGKSKSTDFPIIPKAVYPFVSIQVGEDAFFSRHDSMGIADGVGGWAKIKGSNAALYSLKMMHYVGSQLEKYDDMSEEYDFTLPNYDTVSPKEILAQSYDLVNIDAERENIVGSTTAIVLHDELRVANIGDCAVMLIRGGESVFRSEEQQHSFNFPYQLGTVSQDSPQDTQNFEVKIQAGDIVILGSDGLFDNVFDQDIVKIVSSQTHNKVELSNAQKMADALLRKAREVAEDSRFSSSPFQTKALNEGLFHRGGKIDDMTVLVGIIRYKLLIRESEDSPDRR